MVYLEQEDGDRLGVTVKGLHVFLGKSTDPKDEIDPSMFTLTRTGVKLHPPVKAAAERNLKLLEADRVRRLPLRTSLTVEVSSQSEVPGDMSQEKKRPRLHLNLFGRKLTPNK